MATGIIDSTAGLKDLSVSKRGLYPISSVENNHRVQTESTAFLQRARIEQRTCLMEHECKQILENAGIKTTEVMIALCEDEAVEMSRDIGYPVVLKIISPDIIHKTDSGGVKLNLRNDRDVREAYRDILSHFKDRRVIGISVQKMAPQGIEAIIGVTHDKNFGPVIMFGLGGIFTEVLRDVAFRVLPISEDTAAEMIEEIKGYPLLKGYRGQSADIRAVRELLVKVSDLMLIHPEIRELDINPVILYPSGYLAVDARIFIDEAHGNPEEETLTAKDNLLKLFYPQSIAVLGATDFPGKLGFNVMWNLISHNFPKKIYPVNPHKETLLGLKCYRSILEVEDRPDTAIIIVPAEAVPGAIKECCKKGVKYLVVETAGFAETGETGQKIQSDIKNLIKKSGCRLVGPNCSGIINTHHNMVQSIGIIDQLEKGNVGLIAQAGVYAAGMLTGLRNILNFGIIATIGNKMDINEVDILRFMGNDTNIKVIALYMEDMTSGRRFIDTAGQVSETKPVIVLKTGRTEEGKKAASSHTASMAGNDDINDAAFRQSGVIRARDNEHLFSLIRAFSKQPLPKGPGVLVITYTGSLGVATTDILYRNNLKLAELEAHLKKRLSSVLDDYLNVQNPVDCSFSMNPEQVKNIVEIGVHSDRVHSLILILQGEMLDSYIDTLKNLNYRNKPVLCCVACKEFMMDHVIRLEKTGIPVYSTPEMAVEVLGTMYRYANLRNKIRIRALDRFLSNNSFSIDDHRIQMRMLTHYDIDLWTEFVNSCSPRSLWLRFLSPFDVTQERAQKFCNINPDEEVAVVAEIIGDNMKKLVGVGRLIKCRQCDEAEYAVIVTDSWQKKKLGYILSLMCLNLAKHLGIRIVHAEIIDENFPMIKVLNRCSFKMETKERNMLLMSLMLK